MPTYRYQPGDRPLEGFTVRAPAGRGGFGEVYFAESDAGREVALKALFVQQGHDEIELRGIRHCMNLKSPHLVSIFDVKTGHDDTPFVVMEYVAGPSLRDLLNDAPAGLGPDKAAFFLREVAKGLSHLHGYGVVHRDLKPANIFYEDGYVKIGDYGLSKLMSADAAASQTITVGTVHYMAPEIGAGRYDKSIDLYALGCLLYEMLTGRVPYAGESPSEVLMKHLQAEPDLRDVPEHFARVIKKALQKDPDHRYATAAEMVEDLFGQEHVRNSVSQLNAAELSTYAARAGRKIAASPADTTPAALKTLTPNPPTSPSETQSVPVVWSWPAGANQGYLIVATMLALVASFITMISAEFYETESFVCSMLALLTIGPAGAWAASRNQRFKTNPTVGDRVAAVNGPIGAHILVGVPIFLAMWQYKVSGSTGDGLVWTGIVSMLISASVYWPRYTRPDRPSIFSARLWVTTGLAAGISTFLLFPTFFATAFALPVIIGVGAQMLSPVQPRTGQPPSREPTGQRPLPPPSAAAAAAPAPALSDSGLGSAASWRHPQASSRHSRLTALLLCAIIFPTGLAGIHRFYVGRWLSGLVWFFTFGLMGVGQVIDAILIASGRFRDAHGHPLGRWRLAPPAGPLPAGRRVWTPAINGRINPVAMGLHLAGVLVLLLGVAFMLPVWFSLPELVGTLPAFAELRQGIDQTLGYGGWPELTERMLSALGLTTLISGTLLTAFARRGAIAHLLRALAGGALLSFLAVLVATEPQARLIYVSRVKRALQRLSPADPYSPLANVDAILDAAMHPEAVIGLFWLAVAATFFLIPARTQTPAAASQETRP